MSNILKQSYLNPVQVYDINFSPLPQYQSKYMDDVPFKDTIRSWEQMTNYKTKWLKSDSIRIQYSTNYSPLTAKILDSDGNAVYQQTFDTKQQDYFNPDFYIRQIDISLAPFDYGCYELQVVAGSLTLGKECFQICDSLPDSLLIEYSHYESKGGIKFDAPFSPMLRVPGSLVYKGTNSKGTTFIDQSYNESVVKSVSFRVHTFYLGDSYGVPPWLIDKVARIFWCSDLKIDGRYYSRSGDGVEFEANTVENYPMAGWKIDVVPKLNKDGLTYENDSIITGKNSMIAVVGNKGFGTDDSDYSTITEIT